MSLVKTLHVTWDLRVLPSLRVCFGSPALIESDGEVSLERPSIDAVHIVRRALVNPGVHLSSGINLEFRFHSLRIKLPLVYLQGNEISFQR